jgi:hypothetical protein
MFTWLKRFFNFDKVGMACIDEPLPLKEEVKEEAPAKVKKPTKTQLAKMSKKELLEVAKTHGIKANASLKKDELIDKIKNG